MYFVDIPSGPSGTPRFLGQLAALLMAQLSWEQKTASAVGLHFLPKILIACDTVYGVCKKCMSVQSLNKAVNTLLLSVGWQHVLWPSCICSGHSKIV